MFNLVYIIGFLVVIFGLLLWTSFNGKKADKLFRGITITAILAYLGGWLVQVAPVDYKLEILIRDLLVIAASGAVFTYVAKMKKLFLLLLAMTIGGAYWYYKTQLTTTFPFVADITTSEVVMDPSGELLVELHPGTMQSDLSEFKSFVEENNLTYTPAFSGIADPDATDLDDYLLVDVPQNAKINEIIAGLNGLNSVEWVEVNEQVSVSPILSEGAERQRRKINPQFGIDDPGLTELWSFPQMKMDQLYNLLESNEVKPVKKALIAILDTGVDSQHEDLKANYTSVVRSSDDDPKGHGTHCAGIAGAVTNNGLGVASYSRDNGFTQITSIKVLNSMGFGSQKSIINGITKAADKGAAVISLSLGGPSNDLKQKAYTQAVEYANKKGAIVIAAAGNSNANAKNYSPVNATGIIGVSAVDQSLNRASFSNFVQDIKMGIAAPGVGIYSTIPGNKYATYNGTSMATPYVAGLVGLMKSIKPDLKTKEAYQILKKTGVKTGNPRETGAFIQPPSAVKELLK